MPAKILNRSIRSRLNAAVIWAMVPLAMISGKTVSGCMSPTGHFEPGCHCEAMQETGGSEAHSNQTSISATCRCHCPCCHGNCCCGKGKVSCCTSLARNARKSNGDGLQSNDHCRPFAMYTVTPAVNASMPLGNMQQSANLAIVSLDLPSSLTSTTINHIDELSTGPPPDNLVVALRRFLI